MRKLSHLSWGALTDSVSVFVLFLLVGAFHSQRIPTLTIIQTRYLPALYLVWAAVCKCNFIGHLTHTNTVGLRPQRRGLQATHLRYILSASTCFFWETDRCYGQMYVRSPYQRNLSSRGVGVRKPRSSNPCSSRSLLRFRRLSWLKGLTFAIDSNASIHPCRFRTYAITLKNKWIAGFLYTLATAEFGLGFYSFVYDAMNPGQ